MMLFSAMLKQLVLRLAGHAAGIAGGGRVVEKVQLKGDPFNEEVHFVLAVLWLGKRESATEVGCT